MKYSTITAGFVITLATSLAAFAQAPAPYSRSSSFSVGAPPEVERFFWSVQLGAMAQLATAVILLVGLSLILPRLRQIEAELKRPKT